MLQRSMFTLDRLLRGEAIRPDSLRSGRFDIQAWELALIVLIFAATSGLGIGSYSLIHYGVNAEAPGTNLWLQPLASALKLPTLFFLTVLITFPSLYVFNALIGSPLSIGSVARLLLAMLTVTLTVLTSLIPILVFFSFSTSSYLFMKLLTALMAAIAGFLGLGFLIRTLLRLRAANVQTDQNQHMVAYQGRGSLFIFSVWVVVFSLVGVQMSWLLRPFIGSPDSTFTWLRSHEANFFLDVAHSIGKLLGV